MYHHLNVILIQTYFTITQEALDYRLCYNSVGRSLVAIFKTFKNDELEVVRMTIFDLASVSIGRTDAEAEASILWPPDVKS